MPVLEQTAIAGQIAWLGVVPDRNADLCSQPRDAVEVGFDGLEGECHGGLTRPSCSRVRHIYPERGTVIRNTRQISVLSVEELAATAAAMGIARLRPEWVGANLVLEGVPDLTLLPPGGRLVFEDGPVLTVDVENGPCRHPGEVIEHHHPGRGSGFARAAGGRRGVTVWVERPGRLRLGQPVRLFAPPQRPYPHL